MNSYLFIRHRLSSFIILCLVSLIGVQCKREESTTDSPTPSVSSQLKVSADYAVNIAKAFQTDPQNKNARLSADSKDSLVVETTETLTDQGQSIFHIINYKDNRGWIIVGADRRISPVLAFGLRGKFSLKSLPDGVDDWVHGVTNLAKKAFSEMTKPEQMIENRWKHIEISGKLSQSLPGGRSTTSNCSSYDQYIHQCPANTFVGSPGASSYLGLADYAKDWNQVSAYSYSTPSYASASSSSCNACSGHSITGCGPLAIATVLRTNNKLKGTTLPAGFDYSNMSETILPSHDCSTIAAREIVLTQLIA